MAPRGRGWASENRVVTGRRGTASAAPTGSRTIWTVALVPRRVSRLVRVAGVRKLCPLGIKPGSVGLHAERQPHRLPAPLSQVLAASKGHLLESYRIEQ